MEILYDKYLQINEHQEQTAFEQLFTAQRDKLLQCILENYERGEQPKNSVFLTENLSFMFRQLKSGTESCNKIISLCFTRKLFRGLALFCLFGIDIADHKNNVILEMCPAQTVIALLQQKKVFKLLFDKTSGKIDHFVEDIDQELLNIVTDNQTAIYQQNFYLQKVDLKVEKDE